MRDRLTPIRLISLHSIIKKEIDQDGIDARTVRLVDTLLLRVFLRRAFLLVHNGSRICGGFPGPFRLVAWGE